MLFNPKETKHILNLASILDLTVLDAFPQLVSFSILGDLFEDLYLHAELHDSAAPAPDCVALSCRSALISPPVM